ncbi:MAG: phage virion morphogenesis protein [Patescibacteria group bacterium]|nr:phage virion morphogenesis protein [Patescibacteria group bacterium]
MPKDFAILWTIEGVPELSRLLKMKGKNLDNYKTPLKESADLILSDVSKQFRTEGNLSGGWEPLALSTLIGKARQGYGDKPILERTGKLKKSFYKKVSKKRAYVSSSSPYFGFHQSRAPRTKIPRRPMLLLTEKTKHEIVRKFQRFIQNA